MLTEGRSGEDEVGTMDVQSLADIDLGIRKISVSPALVTHDLSSMNIETSSFSNADAHLDSDSSRTNYVMSADDVSADTFKADVSEVACLFNQFELLGDERKDDIAFLSSGSPNIKDPSTYANDMLPIVKNDQIREQNHPFLCSSSERCRNEEMLHRKKEPLEPSKNGRKVERGSESDITSFNILRKSRSSSSKPARSSIWGSQVQILPEISGDIKPDKRLRVRDRNVKRNATRNRTVKRSTCKSSSSQKGKKSSEVSCPTVRHISLKIKIGNKSCIVGNGNGSISELGQGAHDSFDAPGCKIREKGFGGHSTLHERDDVKVSVSDYSPHDINVDDTLSLKNQGGSHQVRCLKDEDNFVISTENRFSDVGTSPDSEVINSVPDAPLCEKGLSCSQDGSGTLNAFVPSSNTLNPILPRKTAKRGKKKDELCQVEDVASEKQKREGKTNAVQISDSSREIGCLSIPLINSAKGLVAAVTSATSKVSGMLSNHKVVSLEYSGSKRGNKARSTVLSHQRKGKKSSKGKGKNSVVVEQHEVSKKTCAFGAHSEIANLMETGEQTPPALLESRAVNNVLVDPSSDKKFSSDAQKDQYTTMSRNAWVLCDDCQKWRRIPATLADQIEKTDCGWTCKENMDRDFAECSVPQEKSNSEINDELELFDESAEEDTQETFVNSSNYQSKVPAQSSWSVIRSNIFLHRKRKTQTIDEVMVCHCKPSSEGRKGCGANCLNRMLNIECVRGTCPCGDLCSNQQFQKRKYAKLKRIKCGKKGYGLQAVEDISEGRFLIEYVGEVLDMHTYEARQREYAMNGHVHFYFMTLNGSEVIDACAKGNLGRLINHSCDPNCRTEKWMVNGEVCVGLFALRDIKKGEEVTFDYNYVRVFGAAAKKCVCGSANCRGYIGGDPTNSDQIIEDDSDEEFKEPISDLSKTEALDVLKVQPAKKCTAKKMTSAASRKVHTKKQELQDSIEEDIAVKVEQSDRSRISEDSLDETVPVTLDVESQDLVTQVHPSDLPLEFLSSEDISSQNTSSANVPTVTASAPCEEPSPETLESKQMLDHAHIGGVEIPEKPGLRVKSRFSSLPIKRGSRKMKVGIEKGTSEVNKLNASLDKSKNMVECSLNGHFEAVEKKLNELLDTEGGISKRKDASRGYLKLLFLTVASGNSGDGEAIQSNRDLSMILDALLKTRSRSVLVDIINKNGLQMLHNIMKRYRKEFIKTPILRKLLKVLEYLAMREILTLEHISGGPACPGVESFKDSILTLTEHSDKQVHQIARSFRDRWIPKPIRRNDFQQRLMHSSVLGSSSHCFADRSGKSSCGDSQPIAPSASASTAVPVGLSSTLPCSPATSGTRIRKRKSRWDCPAEDYPNSRVRSNFMGDEKMNIDDDVPPGFSFNNCAPLNSCCNQERETKIDEGATPGNMAMTSAAPSSGSNMDKEMNMQVDSRTGNNLAGDEMMATDEDAPPGFSSPCNLSVVQSDPSLCSVAHQEMERCCRGYQSGITSSTSKEWMKTHDSFGTNHQQRDIKVQPYQDSRIRNCSLRIDNDAFRSSSTAQYGFPVAASISMNHRDKEMHMKQNLWDTVCGEPQSKFNARMPLSYGIPYSAVQQVGVLKEQGWVRAPGVPFHPFPPLPPQACGMEELGKSAAVCSSSFEAVENSEQSCSTFSHHADQKL